MTDQKPTVTPAETAPVLHEPDTAARLLDDAETESMPGGGGLGGDDAAGALSGTARGAGGAAPNSPIDLDVPAEPTGSGADEHDAKVRALKDDAR